MLIVFVGVTGNVHNIFVGNGTNFHFQIVTYILLSSRYHPLRITQRGS
jgi:hypothetical protein